MQETQVLNQLIWLPLIFLSGGPIPLATLPKVAQAFAIFLPPPISSGVCSAAIFSSLAIWKLWVEADFAAGLGYSDLLRPRSFPLGAGVEDPAQR